MKKLFKTTIVIGIMTLGVILPSSGINNYSRSYTPRFMENKLKKKNIDLNEAKKIVLMNDFGTIGKTHTIHNTKNEEIYFINLIKEDLIRLYMIEQNGNCEIVEEMPLLHK